MTPVKTGYPLTSITWPYRGLKCRPIEFQYFLKLSADKLPVSNDRRLKFIFFQGFISNMLCLCHYGPARLGFWFQTDLGSENSSSFFKSTGGEDLILPWSRVGLFPLEVQNEIQLLSRVFCYSWLVCLLGFGREMCRLSKFGNSISEGIVFVFHLAFMRKRV